MRYSSQETNDLMKRFLSENGDKEMSEIASDSIEAGKRYLDSFLTLYGDIPMVEIVNGLWEKRKKSNLVKWLMLQSDLSMDRLAAFFGCSKQYLNNKFNRDSFSFEDIIITAYACDYTLALLANNRNDKRRIDAENFFDKDPETWNRISGLKAESRDSKRAEYEQKKAELERMKQEYGFED